MAAISLNYRLDGAGPRIVLLHPIGLDLTFFDALVVELSPFFQILRVDLRGHGESPWIRNDAAVRLEDFAADVHASLQHLRYRPAAVIGFSLGGMVAQTLALNHPNDVNALVSAACGGTFGEQVRKALRERGDCAMRLGMASILESTAERWFSASFRDRGGDTAALRRLLANDTQSWRQAWYAIAELNTAPRLHEIAVPTLCLAGEEDISTPPKMVQDVAKAISGASFAAIPKMPHMLFIEDPQAVAKEITKFLKAHLVV